MGDDFQCGRKADCIALLSVSWVVRGTGNLAYEIMFQHLLTQVSRPPHVQAPAMNTLATTETLNNLDLCCPVRRAFLN